MSPTTGFLPPVAAGSAVTVSTVVHGRRPARDGALAMIPLVVAYTPFALVIGAAAPDHGAPVAGWAGSWLIYGGSAHLASIRTLEDAGPWMAILTGLLINSRLLVYSAALARSWPQQPKWFRIAAAGLIIDPTFAAAERHAAGCGDAGQQRRYFVAAGLTLGAGWSTAIAMGAVVGSRLDGIDLEIVVPLCLLALVGDGLRLSGSRLVVIVAAVVAALAASLPAGTGLLAAVAAGAGAGLVWDRRSR
jgi:predicted branched-subunit amino acid permease